MLETLPWICSVIALSLPFTFLIISGLLIVRKYVGIQKLKSHHDVAGFTFANLGVLYAVLLGFTVVNVQGRFDKTRSVMQTEATALAGLYRDAGVFQEKDRQNIRKSIKNYCERVINEEWILLAQGKECLNTAKQFQNIWSTYYAIEPTTNKQIAWYSESISQLNNLIELRLSRILGSSESLGAEMWTLLLLGGIILATFVWFFGLESLTAHILMTTVLSTSITLFLLLIYSLDTAFSGQISIEKESFLRVLESCQG